MAANGASDGRAGNEESLQQNNSSETLSEGTGPDIRGRAMPESGTFWPSPGPAMTPGTTSVPAMIPMPTIMAPVTVPDVPGLKVNIVPGLEAPSIEIQPLDPNLGSSEEAMDETWPRPKMRGSLFLGVGLLPLAIINPLPLQSSLTGILERKLTLWLSSQHLASYPSVKRLSHFIQESLPLGPFIVQTSRSVAESTGRRILRPIHVTPTSLEASQPGADQRNDPALRRLLQLLDATAAHALRGIDHIVLLFLEAGGKLRRWVVSSTSQLRDLVNYLQKTYYQEASKWAGAGDVVVFFGAVSFTVAVGAFDALVYVAEWFFDGREVREIKKRERVISI